MSKRRIVLSGILSIYAVISMLSYGCATYGAAAGGGGSAYNSQGAPINVGGNQYNTQGAPVNVGGTQYNK